VDERALEELRRLARQDRELEAEADALHALDAEVSAIRRSAEAIAAFSSTYEAEKERRAADLQEARDELARRHEELQQAEREAATAHDEAGREYAEKAVTRARDHIAVGEARLSRAEAAGAALEATATGRPDELVALDARARAIANVAPPAGDLSEWASRAHAELFVAVGQVDTRRERLIREANELASMLLGEPTYGSTAAQALRQVERYWTSSPGHVSESR
jgi:vacuolar-type H+-ATPase subunit I/STV1